MTDEAALALLGRTLILIRAKDACAVEHHTADDGSPYTLILSLTGEAAVMICQRPGTDVWALVDLPSYRTIATALTPEGLTRGFSVWVDTRGCEQEAA